jgi:anti-sigma regulatory factor (Ser/Thr protein kinase)
MKETAFPVTESSQVSEARRDAVWLAETLGFSEERSGRVALVVSELGSNLVKHARGGEILIDRVLSGSGEAEGIEVVALDTGPGLGDATRSQRDGYSTSGTLGHGLGAIERQSDIFDLYTDAKGTAIVASIFRDEPARRRVAHDRYDVGAIHLAKPGEEVCGDGWGWRMRDERLAVIVADGLGHGLQAREAADAALRVFATDHESAPARVVEDVHAALRATRGAAVAMLAVDPDRGTARYAGLGNISATVLAPAGTHRLVSHNGTAGQTAARIHEFTYPIPTGSVIVMASDGLGTHWGLDAYPGLRRRRSTTIAGILYRDFSRRRDDVTVVVAKERPPVAEKE